MKRRELIAKAGAGVLGAAGAYVLSACGGNDAPAPSQTSPTANATPSAQGPGCVLTPELAEGPFYIPNEPLRRDVTEGRPGAPLTLELTVVDAEECVPIPGATVEIWHTDAEGNYAGFGTTTSNTSFMRGRQRCDDRGITGFDTVYPGWYAGRTTHIHTKVHVGGDAVHTGQLFFDDALSDLVYAESPYNSRGQRDTRNADDGIFAEAGEASVLRLSTREQGGYLGLLTLGVRS